ncbi:uncharacterized protein K02A2.6-like [Ylistrum balloti]|uniref:uncharacterized protein K02A2.6-like n=1 Tax=Ylistrum balloti TaxID=509963 RepID=UPI002905C44A|nr:uncharacterized protein K02A2.6-like [Ylistrum balloti]
MYEATQQDETLQRVVNSIVKGWPDDRSKCTPDVVPYWNFRNELTVINGLVFKGTRLVIPAKLRKEMLTKIHHGHLGREKCKKRARELLFWPNMNAEINEVVDNCDVCQRFAMKQQAEPLQPTPVSKSPWERVSTDLFSLGGKDYIVTCDSFSNYPEVLLLPNQTAFAVINALKSIFSRHGVPQILTSDNGPCYSCREFKDFAREWDIKHITSSPKFPQSNGLAKRTVQTIKNMMKKHKESNQDIHMALLAYRTTPLGNGRSPAEMLMGRCLKTNLPNYIEKSRIEKADNNSTEIMKWRENEKQKQKHYYDQRNHVKSHVNLAPGDKVRIQEQNAWSTDRATVLNELGPRSYLIRRNRKHLKLIPDDEELPKTGNNVLEPIPDDVPDQTNVSDTDVEPKTSRCGRTVKRPQRLIEQC